MKETYLTAFQSINNLQEIKKMKLSLEKEKASLKEEKSYNLRLLEMNEKKEKEMLQLTQRHGKKN